MKKSLFRHLFDATMLFAFAWYGIHQCFGKALIFLAILVVLVLIEMGIESKKQD